MRLRAFAVGDPSRPKFEVGKFAKAKYEENSVFRPSMSDRPVVGGRSYKIEGIGWHSYGVNDRVRVLLIKWADGMRAYPERAFVPVKF